MDQLNELLAGLPGAERLTTAMKQHALDGALVPDSAGVWPGQPGYVTTYDVYYAALTLLGFLQAQPVVRSASSEGSSVSVDAPDWAALARYYRSLSRICGLGDDVLRIVPIPGGPHVVPTDMSGRWDGYGDVDTDLG